MQGSLGIAGRRLALLLVFLLLMAACNDAADDTDTAGEAPDDDTAEPVDDPDDGDAGDDEQEAPEDVGSLDVAMTTPSPDLMLPMLANDLGCFEEEGLDVEIFVFGGGPEGRTALINGDVDIVVAALPEPARAQEVGEDMVTFYGGNTSDFSWWVQPEVGDIEGLEGGSIIVNPLNSTPHLLTVHMLDTLTEFGSDAVEYVPVSGPGARLAALEAGQADGAILALVESYQAEEQGFIKVAGLEDLPAAFPNTYNAMRDLLDERPEAVQAFVNGIECAIDAWDNDVDAVAPLVADFTGYDEDLARRFIEDSRGRDPECGAVAREDSELVIEALKATGDLTKDLTHDDIVDDRYIGC